MKKIVSILARVSAPTNYNSEYKVELSINEGVRNPKFPQATNTYAIFKPNTEIHMRKSTLDFLLLNQGKAVHFGERDKVVTVSLDNIPAEFIKGYKKTNNERYYAIKADLSTTPGETHNKWFFTDPMSVKMCEEFVTEHKFEESEEQPEDEVEESDAEETE